MMLDSLDKTLYLSLILMLVGDGYGDVGDDFLMVLGVTDAEPQTKNPRFAFKSR